jgi:phosphoribosylformimino-5-aminoimidazole carboxamide ribotide isomerase
MYSFTVFPAIDLRHGTVVRLREGNPNEITTYSTDPQYIALEYLKFGFKWIHIVNLDGAFGERDHKNRQVLKGLVQLCAEYDAHIQFGGGLRTYDVIHDTLQMGVSRVVLGTVLADDPGLLTKTLQIFGPQKIVAGIDARDGLVRVRGWAQRTPLRAVDLAEQMAVKGLEWIIFTDVARDGMENGINLTQTKELAKTSGLKVIASGGVKDLDDVLAARKVGLQGVIVGRALYEGRISPIDLAEIDTLDPQVHK